MFILFNFKQISQAVELSSVSFIKIAFNKPLPLTDFNKLFSLEKLDNSVLKRLPNFSALAARFSSTATFNAAIATLQPKGLPPKVEPCSPGLIVIIISSSARAAETGKTPPDNAFPKIKISGLTPSCWQQYSFPVLEIPV